MDNISDICAQYKEDLLRQINKIDDNMLNSLLCRIIDCLEKHNTIFIAGNGGSAATASHLACDLVKISKVHKLKIMCLNDNVPIMTAISNDINYEEVFSFQLASLAKVGDLLIVISASGNSPNIIRVVEASIEKGVETFGLIGFDGGKVVDLLDDYILVDDFNYGVVEDMHLVVCHMISKLIKESLKLLDDQLLLFG